MGLEAAHKGTEPTVSPQMMRALSTQISTIRRIAHRLPATLESKKNKTVILIALTALILAGCGPSMTSAEIQNYQGTFNGVDAQTTHLVKGGYKDDFTYTSAVNQLVAAAQARGVSQEDINLALSSASIETRLSILSQTPGANATIEIHPKPDKTHTPATLSIVPSEDGVFNVVVAGQECLTGQNICTMPTTFSLNISADNTAPTVTLGKPKYVNGKLIVDSVISDPSGVGVATASTCGNPNGQGKAPLAMENQGGGNYSIVISPKTGEVICVEAVATDTLGNASNPQTSRSQESYVVGATIATGSDIGGDGKPTGTINFTPSGTTNFGVPVNTSVQACDGSPLNGTVMNGVLTGVVPKIGDTCAVAVAADQFGNTARSAEIHSPYKLDVSSVNLQQQDDKLHVEGKTQTSNGVPAVNVVVESCTVNQPIATLPVAPDTGIFVGDIAPSTMGDNCVRVGAVDKFSQTGLLSEGHGQYIFHKPQVSVQFNPKDASHMFIYLNAPNEALLKSVSANGEQAQWKKFGMKGQFTCTDLGMDGVDLAGNKWQVELSCYLPSGDVGSPLIHLNMLDKNGFSLQATYPVDSNFVVPLRENPSVWEEVSYFGPLLAGMLLVLSTGAAAGKKYGPGLYDYLNESARANAISDITRNALKSTDEFLSQNKGGRSLPGFEKQINVVLDAKSAINAKIPPRAPEHIKRPRQKRGEEFRALQIQELEASRIRLLVDKTFQYFNEWHPDENATPPNARHAHEILEATKEINDIYSSRVLPDADRVQRKVLRAYSSKIKEWIFAHVDKEQGLRGMIESEKRQGMQGDVLELLLDLQVSGKYEALWKGMQLYNLSLAQKIREITLCYAVAKKVPVRKNGKSVEILLIDNPNVRRKIATKLIGEGEEFDDASIILYLGKHRMADYATVYLEESRSLREKVALISGYIQVGDLQTAMALFKEVGEMAGEKTQIYRTQIAGLIARRIHDRVDKQLPLNRKIDRASITELVRGEFGNQTKELQPYFEMVVEAIENMNMTQYILK